MAAQGAKSEQIYATLLLSDSYLPGALVLAHSLRDAGANRKLAVLVTLDSVSADSITQLKNVYDYVFPVPRIRNDHPANLYLMNRGDLHSAFTKINLWKLTQFSKIVYIDADVVAYRAPEELFDLPHPFAAAPDIGWPDLFNTGVMVLDPNMGDYYAMIAMAERGISFDGADQGLINMHFGQRYHRLSFTYNVTPSAHYQYVPAYRHFQSSINMVHFIGADKPWFTGRDAPAGSNPFSEMIGRWWAVYDRHYRHQESSGDATQYVQYFTKGEWRPQSVQAQPSTSEEQSHGQSSTTSAEGQHQEHHTPQPEQRSEPQHHEQHSTTQPGSAPQQQHQHQEPKKEPPPITMHDWDAQRHPPPSDSRPEAMNFPSTHYEMSRDTAPFVPPVRYPSPPKNMWYEVPKEKPAPRSKPAPEIFPWERNRPRPTRTFAGEPEPEPEPEPKSTTPEESSAPLSVKTEGLAETKNESTTTTPIVQITPSDPWTSYTRTNAWDEVPEIERYVDRLHGGHRRGKSSTSSTGRVKSPTTGSWRDDKSSFKLRGLKLTDFPSAVERPSLPVTPAPVHRNSFFAEDDAEHEDEGAKKLPEAEGVPAQSDWVCVHGRRWGPTDCLCEVTDLVLHHQDPLEQLQKLAKQQSDALLRRLSGDGTEGGEGGVSREIPTRPLPFGSGDSKSPTYVAQSATGVLSPQPVKGERSAGILRDMSSGRLDPESTSTSQATTIPEPSYSGPGAAWEKGEDVPQREAPLPPNEAELDALNA
ncbi:glycogenin glucosyltransferase [Fusarium irregulare]|uniref:glycogenin glucosyltransferase n=1 Tax=Fusarium irregulare TaxID=2494466 RepID=A0A9W8UA81_9HYPO|nr:glycogenin glucosyltransferase [Fusarium irregulare]KAJ4018440.1 glycogenin glucosyltransferase [Fusarium irregulare]